MSRPPEGLLLVDKPVGPTSHDVVDRVRRILRQRRVGHTGTLDPSASGLLPLVLGRATRMARFLPHSPKTYEGTLRLGLSTSTDDLSGEILHRFDGTLPPREEVVTRAARFRGTILQVPPAVSARKVQGQRLYRLAREGRLAKAPPAVAEILRFEIHPTDAACDWTFVAEVSAGTYVRALARDLGKDLGCGGILVRLRRVAIGPMHVSSAVTITSSDEDLAGQLWAATIPLEAMPLGPTSTHLQDWTAARRFLVGLPVPRPAGSTDAGTRAVFDPAGKLLGVAEAAPDHLRPTVVLPTAAALSEAEEV